MAQAALAQDIEDDLKPLPWSVPEKPQQPSMIEPEIKQAKEMANDGPNYTFESLKRRVDHDTIKALTLRPFRFQNMSEVQYRVLSQMPEIAGIMERPPHGMSTREWLESLSEGSEGRKILQDKIENGVRKKDMLVKAKTGTGKTIVSDLRLGLPLLFNEYIDTLDRARRLSWYLPLREEYTALTKRATRAGRTLARRLILARRVSSFVSLYSPDGDLRTVTESGIDINIIRRVVPKYRWNPSHLPYPRAGHPDRQRIHQVLDLAQTVQHSASGRWSESKATDQALEEGQEGRGRCHAWSTQGLAARSRDGRELCRGPEQDWNGMSQPLQSLITFLNTDRYPFPATACPGRSRYSFGHGFHQ